MYYGANSIALQKAIEQMMDLKYVDLKT